MSSKLNIQLTDELRKYIDERASDKDLYAMPNEYIHDLVRQGMRDRDIAQHILIGLEDLKNNQLVSDSIFDIANKD